MLMRRREIYKRKLEKHQVVGRKPNSSNNRPVMNKSFRYTT
jgi:hypothetical protein